ncbi:MAG: type III pantothenate kinase [bacterium]
MILTLLAGNHNTRLVLWNKNRIRRRKILPTNQMINHLDRLIASRTLEGAALASVVPDLTPQFYHALCQHTPTLHVTTRTPTPLKICYRRNMLGTDRLCAAVGGYLRYRRNLIVVDFGTATTVNIVHYKEKTFLGGPILPGFGIILKALAENTAQLPVVKLSPRANPLVTNTRTAICAGVYNLILGGLIRIIKQICCRTKKRYRILATGGEAKLWSRNCPLINKVDPELASFGLLQIYYFNRRKNESF